MTTYTDNAVAMQNGEEPLGQGCDASFQEAPATTMNQTGENVGVRSLGIDDAIGFEGDTSDREKCKIAKKPLYYRIIKRVFDIVFSLVVMVVAFIPLLILSVFIAFDTKAFPIYSQERIGQHGPFKFYKLRSMVKDSDDVEKHFTPEQLDQWNKEHKVDNDPRVASRIIDATARRSSFGPAVASVFPPKMTEISAVFSQVKLSISNLRNLLKNSFQNLSSHTPATTNFFAERKSAPISWGGASNALPLRVYGCLAIA